jgi:hypothetical protein
LLKNRYADFHTRNVFEKNWGMMGERKVDLGMRREALVGVLADKARAKGMTSAEYVEPYKPELPPNAIEATPQHMREFRHADHWGVRKALSLVVAQTMRAFSVPILYTANTLFVVMSLVLIITCALGMKSEWSPFANKNAVITVITGSSCMLALSLLGIAGTYTKSERLLKPFGRLLFAILVCQLVGGAILIDKGKAIAAMADSGLNATAMDPKAVSAFKNMHGVFENLYTDGRCKPLASVAIPVVCNASDAAWFESWINEAASDSSHAAAMKTCRTNTEYANKWDSDKKAFCLVTGWLRDRLAALLLPIAIIAMLSVGLEFLLLISAWYVRAKIAEDEAIGTADEGHEGFAAWLHMEHEALPTEQKLQGKVMSVRKLAGKDRERKLRHLAAQRAGVTLGQVQGFDLNLHAGHISGVPVERLWADLSDDEHHNVEQMVRILDAKVATEERIEAIHGFDFTHKHGNLWGTLKSELGLLSIWYSQENALFSRPQRITILIATLLTTGVLDAIIYNGDEASMPGMSFAMRGAMQMPDLASPNFKAPDFSQMAFWLDMGFQATLSVYCMILAAPATWLFQYFFEVASEEHLANHKYHQLEKAAKLEFLNLSEGAREDEIKVAEKFKKRLSRRLERRASVHGLAGSKVLVVPGDDGEAGGAGTKGGGEERLDKANNRQLLAEMDAWIATLEAESKTRTTVEEQLWEEERAGMPSRVCFIIPTSSCFGRLVWRRLARKRVSEGVDEAALELHWTYASVGDKLHEQQEEVTEEVLKTSSDFAPLGRLRAKAYTSLLASRLSSHADVVPSPDMAYSRKRKQAWLFAWPYMVACTLYIFLFGICGPPQKRSALEMARVGSPSVGGYTCAASGQAEKTSFLWMKSVIITFVLQNFVVGPLVVVWSAFLYPSIAIKIVGKNRLIYATYMSDIPLEKEEEHAAHVEHIHSERVRLGGEARGDKAKYNAEEGTGYCVKVKHLLCVDRHVAKVVPGDDGGDDDDDADAALGLPPSSELPQLGAAADDGHKVTTELSPDSTDEEVVAAALAETPGEGGGTKGLPPSSELPQLGAAADDTPNVVELTDEEVVAVALADAWGADSGQEAVEL